MTGVPVDDPTRVRSIVALISERATCLVCLASKIGATPRDAVRTLAWIANTLRFDAQARAHCGLCDLVVGPVYSIARPDERPLGSTASTRLRRTSGATTPA